VPHIVKVCKRKKAVDFQLRGWLYFTIRTVLTPSKI
jgi:hypothetical protein